MAIASNCLPGSRPRASQRLAAHLRSEERSRPRFPPNQIDAESGKRQEQRLGPELGRVSGRVILGWQSRFCALSVEGNYAIKATF